MGTSNGTAANGDARATAKKNVAFTPTDKGRAMDKRLDGHIGCVSRSDVLVVLGSTGA